MMDWRCRIKHKWRRVYPDHLGECHPELIETIRCERCGEVRERDMRAEHFMGTESHWVTLRRGE